MTNDKQLLITHSIVEYTVLYYTASILINVYIAKSSAYLMACGVKKMNCLLCRVSALSNISCILIKMIHKIHQIHQDNEKDFPWLPIEP